MILKIALIKFARRCYLLLLKMNGTQGLKRIFALSIIVEAFKRKCVRSCISCIYKNKEREMLTLSVKAYQNDVNKLGLIVKK